MNAFSERAASCNHLLVVHAHVHRVSADLNVVNLLGKRVSPYIPELYLSIPTSTVHHVYCEWREFSNKHFVLVHRMLVFVKAVYKLVCVRVKDLKRGVVASYYETISIE